MKFDSEENAVVRAITVAEGQTSAGERVTLFRIRFTDGKLFAWYAPIFADIKPLDLAKIFEGIAAEIKTSYKLESK